MNVDDFATLEQDADLAMPLRRVAYEAGMMLGLEATRDEQAYHRRRLARHQYWLQGYGTCAGMRVSQAPESHTNDSDAVEVRLLVSPGFGIDRLGREVLIHETHCIHLREWLDANKPQLHEGYDDAADALWLKVCVRQKDCQVAQQPVLARKLNLSTDAVRPSRIADGIRLELIPELPVAGEPQFAPWGCHPPLSDAAPTVTAVEREMLDTLIAENEAAGSLLELQARLLGALDGTGVSTQQLHEQLDLGARLLLARIRITVTDIDNIVVNPQRIAINNLVRPFLVSASQLAWLDRKSGTGGVP